MITLDIDRFQIQSSAESREIRAALAGDATAAEIRTPPRGVASDPVGEWLADADEWRGVSSALRLELPEVEWKPEHEQAFADLAGREALGLLSKPEAKELARLVGLRRGVKNPRSGDELVREYEQRELTRDLIKALDRYVKFHKSSGFEEQAES
jgi:hypothetical protein